MKSSILGLDIGTSSVKGLLCNLNGKIITQAEAANQLISTHAGWAEQSPDRWIENVFEVIHSCLQTAKISGADIAAVGISGMVPALLLLDQRGKVLRPAIQYNDARAGEEISEFEKKIGNERFFQLTGARLSAQSIGPKLAWLKRHEPQVWEQTATVMGSFEYIGFCLTQSLFAERNWALESGLMDIHSSSWSTELLRIFDLPAEIFPPIKSPTDVIGEISYEAARKTNLVAGTPVVAGSADHVAAALASGIIHTGDVLIKFGSSGDILYCCDELKTDPRLFIDYHDIPGKSLLNGCMATSGSLLKWYVNQFCEADRVNAMRGSKNVYEYLDCQAEQIPAGSEGVIVLPYFLGEKTPVFDTSARGTFFGLNLSHNRHHLYRAVLEAVVFGFKHHLEVLNDMGLPIRRIIASEGGARSALWRQISADILEMPVKYLLHNPGSAYGAAVVAGMGTGLLKGWDIVEQDVLWGADQIPNFQNQPVYRNAYQTYRSLYPQLKPLFG